MTHRFFASTPEAYELLRQATDVAWGYPTQYTQTCVPPADQQFKDESGNCIIALRAEWLEWQPVALLVPQAIASGFVSEISEHEYMALLPKMP